jgi:hypothetical protein
MEIATVKASFLLICGNGQYLVVPCAEVVKIK